MFMGVDSFVFYMFRCFVLRVRQQQEEKDYQHVPLEFSSPGCFFDPLLRNIKLIGSMYVLQSWLHVLLIDILEPGIGDSQL